MANSTTNTINKTLAIVAAEASQAPKAEDRRNQCEDKERKC
jgi:hypothetical protein